MLSQAVDLLDSAERLQRQFFQIGRAHDGPSWEPPVDMVDNGRQMDLLVDFFREHLPGYEDCGAISSATTLGVRETRRILGEYVIDAEEMAAGDGSLH